MTEKQLRELEVIIADYDGNDRMERLDDFAQNMGALDADCLIEILLDEVLALREQIRSLYEATQ